MVTGVQEEIPYRSRGTSARKQKKGALHKSEPQFRSENTAAIINAGHVLLAFQPLVSNSNSANFNNNIKRVSKLPKALTTTMPTFDGKSEKFKLFEDLFYTGPKFTINSQKKTKSNYFHSLMRGGALQTTKNTSRRKREILRKIQTVFRRNYVKPQSMTTAKHKFQQLVFNSANHKLFDSLDELQKLAKDAFRVVAQMIIDQVIYAKMPSQLKKLKIQAYLENRTYE